MKDSFKIVVVICVTIVIIFFAYSLYLSPFARCVSELDKKNGPNSAFNHNVICAKATSGSG